MTVVGCAFVGVAFYAYPGLEGASLVGPLAGAPIVLLGSMIGNPHYLAPGEAHWLQGQVQR